jgi:hypothetical protein
MVEEVAGAAAEECAVAEAAMVDADAAHIMQSLGQSQSRHAGTSSTKWPGCQKHNELNSAQNEMHETIQTQTDNLRQREYRGWSQRTPHTILLRHLICQVWCIYCRHRQLKSLGCHKEIDNTQRFRTQGDNPIKDTLKV